MADSTDKSPDASHLLEQASAVLSSVQAILDTTPVLTALQKLSDDQHMRLISRSNPHVMTLELDPNADVANVLSLPPRGSVVLFVAAKGSPWIQRIETAYSTRNYDLLTALPKHFQQQPQPEVTSSLVTQAAGQIIDAPVYFDFRYGAKTLAATVALINGLDAGSILFPFNGGQLRDDDFSIVEYFHPGQLAGYDYLIIKCAPSLSDIERKAVEAVPATQLELNIGSLRPVGFPVDFVRDIIREIARQVDRAVNGRMQGPGPTRELYRRAIELRLPPEVITKLGFVPSARELLNLRRQLFFEPKYRGA